MGVHHFKHQYSSIKLRFCAENNNKWHICSVIQWHGRGVAGKGAIPSTYRYTMRHRASHEMTWHSEKKPYINLLFFWPSVTGLGQGVSNAMGAIYQTTGLLRLRISGCSCHKQTNKTPALMSTTGLPGGGTHSPPPSPTKKKKKERNHTPICSQWD